MRIALVAGEPSGDRLGAALMAGLADLAPGTTFTGVGGPEMAGQGLSSLFPMDELSVMGLAEVLPRYRHLVRRMHQTADHVIATRPDALITVDAPDFGLRVARKVRDQAPGVRTIHYVAPSVWAWRKGRAAKMARHVDQVLCLLPFEPPHMEAAGLRADFVGHPVATEPVATPDEVAAFRARHRLGEAPVVVVLPGSRRGEVDRLTPVFGEALRPVLSRTPAARVVVVAAAPVADAVTAAARGWPGDPVVLDPRDRPLAETQAGKRAAFAAADAALAASGTVSLELAAQGTPMVVAYDMNWLTWQIASRMVKLDTVTLVNLVAGTKAVPEFLGPRCRPGPIGAALSVLLTDPGARAPQVGAMETTMTALGRGAEPPGLRAARAVMDGLDPSPGRKYPRG